MAPKIGDVLRLVRQVGSAPSKPTAVLPALEQTATATRGWASKTLQRVGLGKSDEARDRKLREAAWDQQTKSRTQFSSAAAQLAVNKALIAASVASGVVTGIILQGIEDVPHLNQLGAQSFLIRQAMASVRVVTDTSQLAVGAGAASFLARNVLKVGPIKQAAYVLVSGVEQASEMPQAERWVAPLAQGNKLY